MQHSSADSAKDETPPGSLVERLKSWWRYLLDGKVKYGDILATISIFITLVAFINAINQDRQIRQREQATKIRDAAAATSAKLERWEEVSLSFYNEIQPVFIETSNVFAKNYRYAEARDYLWQQLDVVRLKNQEKLLSENIETAYSNLFGYRPLMRPLFQRTFSWLRSDEAQTYDGLKTALQNKLFENFALFESDYRAGKKEYQTGEMGNALRMVAERYRKSYQQQIDTQIQCIQTFLGELVSKSDSELLGNQFGEVCPAPASTSGGDN
jgi:hypothetical protein